MTTLSQAAVTTVAGTGTTEVTGGVAKAILIGTPLSNSTAFGTGANGTGVDDDDVSTLFDGEINIDVGSDKNYDVHETIVFTDGASIETGLTSANPSEDFGTMTFLEMDKDSMKYQYVFDDLLDRDNWISNATSASSIDITLLGHDLEITAATNTSLTVNLATEYFMKVGDDVVVDGKTVTLEEVGSSSVVINVDGTTEVVDSNTKTVNGIKIRGESYFAKDEVGAGSATISIGEDISKTYKNNDEFIGEDDNDPNWRWELANLATNKPLINVSWDQIVDDSDDTHLVSVENGESVSLPNSYGEVYLNKYAVEDRQEYKVSIETGLEIKGYGGGIGDVTSGKAILFEAVGASGDDAFTVNSSKTDQVWAYLNTTGTNVYFAYLNTTNNEPTFIHNVSDWTDNATARNAFTLDFKDTSVQVTLAVSHLTNDFNWTIGNEDAHGNILLNTENSSNAFEYIGDSDGDTTTANDLRYGTRDISGWDEDTRTQAGFIITSYKDSRASDTVTFSVPGDNVNYDVEVVVGGTTSALAVTGGSLEQADLSSLRAVTFDDVVDKTSGHLILVGGPAVNSLTAEALGLEFPTSGVASTIPENKAILKWIDGAFGGSNTVLIVAGWEAAETQAAASVLQAYSTYSSDLDGKTSVEVVGTTVTAVGADTSAE
ncbi:hypothetical protein HOL82_01410 [Candidatus Woesearchaeota archaeon]|nr:hypothetical protein [Candidatus Woesearchaeota archaeon]